MLYLKQVYALFSKEERKKKMKNKIFAVILIYYLITII